MNVSSVYQQFECTTLVSARTCDLESSVYAGSTARVPGWLRSVRKSTMGPQSPVVYQTCLGTKTESFHSTKVPTVVYFMVRHNARIRVPIGIMPISNRASTTVCVIHGELQTGELLFFQSTW